MPCNVIMKFGQNRFGWTESYARGTDDAFAAATLTQNDITDLMKPRASNVRLVSVSAARVGAPGLPYEFIPPATFTVNGGQLLPASPGAETQDLTTTCAQIRLYTATRRRSRHDLAALKDSQVILDPNGRSIPSAPLRSAMDTYVSWVINGNPNWGMYRGERPVPNNRFAGILSIARSALNPLWTDLTVTGIPPGLDVGQVLQVRRIDQDKFPQLKGFFRVFAIDAGPPAKLTIGYNDRYYLSPYIPAGGIIRLVQYVFDAFTSGEFIRFSEHKRGRPTERSVGRRQPQFRRQ